jgi:hypothetical protein
MFQYIDTTTARGGNQYDEYANFLQQKPVKADQPFFKLMDPHVTQPSQL